MLLGALLLDAIPLRSMEVLQTFAATEALDKPCGEGLSIFIDARHRQHSSHIILGRL
jgi:hypothetical protein